MGHRLVDAGGAPIFVPPDAQAVTIATDGTMSADGLPITQVGLVTVDQPWQLQREEGVLIRTDVALAPVENGTILQGFTESANVNAVAEISRMIQVQRAYEAGQRLMDREDERIRQVITTMAAPA